MPVIPALWEAEAGDSLSPGVQKQPGQHGKNSSQHTQKIQKLAGRGVLCLESQLFLGLRQENHLSWGEVEAAVSQDCAVRGIQTKATVS